MKDSRLLKRKPLTGASDILFTTINISQKGNAIKIVTQTFDEQLSLFPEDIKYDDRELVHLSPMERQVYAHLEQPRMFKSDLLKKMKTRNWKQVHGVLHRLKAKGAISFFIEDGVIISERFSEPSTREPHSVDLFDLPLDATKVYH